MKKLFVITISLVLLIPALTFKARAADQQDIQKATSIMQGFLKNYDLVLAKTQELTAGMAEQNQTPAQQQQLQDLTTPSTANPQINNPIQNPAPQPIEVVPAASP